MLFRIQVVQTTVLNICITAIRDHLSAMRNVSEFFAESTYIKVWIVDNPYLLISHTDACITGYVSYKLTRKAYNGGVCLSGHGSCIDN